MQAFYKILTKRDAHITRTAFSNPLHTTVNYGFLINPLNPELNPICYLLALLAHHFIHVSRIRVNDCDGRVLQPLTAGRSNSSRIAVGPITVSSCRLALHILQYTVHHYKLNTQK